MDNKQALDRLTELENQSTEIKSEIEKLKTQLINPKRSGSVMDRINSFEDAVEETKDNPEVIELLADLKNTTNTASQGIIMIRIIVIAFCEGWKADYSDSNQEKWFPYFQYKTATSGRPAGFVYSNSNYDFVIAYACLGSRFAFPTSEHAECVGKKFENLFNKFL